MAACRRVKEGQAYRFKADLHAKAPNRLWSAELRGRLTTVSTTSDTVAKADAKLTETLRVTDPVLGRLVRKPRQDQFDGRIEVLGRRVPLCVWTSVERASALFDRVQSKLPKVPQFVARTMLPLANDVWLDTPISEPQLLRRLKLTEVSIDDTLSLSFSCGDTFGDHGIAVEIGPRGGLRPPELQ
jgi:hypothetical protein